MRVSKWLGKEGEEASTTSLDWSLSGAQGTIRNGQVSYSLAEEHPRDCMVASSRVRVVDKGPRELSDVFEGTFTYWMCL